MTIRRTLFDKAINTISPVLVTFLYGCRRDGKTTLTKCVIKTLGVATNYYSCGDLDFRKNLHNFGLTKLKCILGKYVNIIFDQAQRIQNIGNTLKPLVDKIPHKRVLLTGSSNLILALNIRASLTGRKKTLHLHHVSCLVLKTTKNEEALKQFVTF